MSKCRICLKTCKRLRSLHDTRDGITFLAMINSFTINSLHKENTFPDQICVFCCNKLTSAYQFKEDLLRSEMILYENAKLRRLCFNNIKDIKINIAIDCKPTASAAYDFLQELVYNNGTATKYKDVTIIKIKENSEHKTQLTVKEFLDSVKLDSNDENYDVYSDYDPIYTYDKSLKFKKKHKLKDRKKKLTSNIMKPIRPVYLKDVKIAHSDEMKKDKLRYKYPRKRSICPYCGKLLQDKYLNIHILNHNSIRAYKCEQCPKSFVTEKFLNTHKQKHLLTTKFKCNKCVASFYSKELLHSHMAVHSEAKNHICDMCNKAFKRKASLRRHLLVHRFGTKSIQCKLCPMTFHFKHLLNHHMRIHTRERPYRCDICSQPYSYKHDFNRHCLKKHGVFLKRRLVNIMNEEVLQQERALMRDLTLRAHGVIKSEDLPRVFEGPRGALAYEAAMKAVEAREIPVTCVDPYRI